MRQKAQEFIRHPLISGSVISVIGAFGGNLFNFGYNLFMSRNLTVSEYGTIATLISLITMITLPAGALLPVVVGFAAKYFANEELDKVHGLYFRIEKMLLVISLFIIIGFLFFSRSIGQFFSIHETLPILLAGLVVVVGFNSTVNSALLQAKLAFGFIASINFLGAGIKFLLGMILVMLGFGVTGAMIAFVVSYSLPFIISFYPLRFLFHVRDNKPKIDNKELITYGVPAAIALFGITSLITTDIILVKHFMSAKTAGLYAGLSLIGRVIFFVSAPIGMVMFPVITQKHAKKENYTNTLLLAIFLVLSPSLFLSIFYFIFPQFVILLFLKKVEYFAIIPNLGMFSIFITVYALLTIFVNFYLAIKKTWIWIPIAFVGILQALLIWFYHNDFSQIIFISLTLASLLLLLLILYYIKLYGEESNAKRQ